MNKEITRSELQTMYTEMTVDDLAERLDVSLVGLYKLLDSAGIERKCPAKGGGKRQKRTSYDLVG